MSSFEKPATGTAYFAPDLLRIDCDRDESNSECRYFVSEGGKEHHGRPSFSAFACQLVWYLLCTRSNQMQMSSLTTSPKDLKKLGSVNAARSAAVRLDTWTVAMAAMFVCGIRPEDNAPDIPGNARLLENALRQASGGQLYEARRVMEEWIDDHEEDLDGEASGSTLVVPMDFLFWCEEALRGKAREPRMLEDFLKYVRPSFEAGVQRPAPHELLNRVVELEAMLPSVGKVSEPTHEFRGHLGDVLTRAYAAAEAPKDRKRVFRALCELAQQQKPPVPLLGYDSSQRKVIYRDKQGRNRLFGESDLRNRKEFRAA